MREVTLRGKGLKNDKEKPSYRLMPWAQLDAVARVLSFGARKYKPNNWQKVVAGEERYLSAAMRHISAICQGEKIDDESGEAHYSHAICSLLFAFWHSSHAAKKNRAKDDGVVYE